MFSARSTRLPPLDPAKSHNAHADPIHGQALVQGIKTNRLVCQTVGGTRESAHTRLRATRRAGTHVLPADVRHRLTRAVRRAALCDALLRLGGDVHDDVLAAIGRPGAQRSQSTPECFNVSHTEQFRPDHWFLQVQAHCVPSALTATETARALQSWRGLHARHDGFKVPAGHASQSALL